MSLSLPDVTLCAVTSINHELTVRAMNECIKHCSFADVVLISSQTVQAPFRVEIVPPFTGADYAPFVCRNLAKYTASAFNLLVQYDGYILEPLAWSDRFFDYDYIGPQWPWHPPNRRVGNSGFCLRSKKLLDILSEIPLPPTGKFVDDEFICHTMRERLEHIYNIRIAPEEVADRFAYERHKPDQPTFGFHGLFNFWRHTEDADMEKIPDLLDDLYIPSRPFVEVVLHYYAARQWRVFACWYRRLHDYLGAPQTRDHLLSFVNEPPFVEAMIKAGDWTSSLYWPRAKHEREQQRA